MLHCRLRRLGALFLAVMMVCGVLFSFSAAADSYVIVYDYDSLSYFTDRTKEQIGLNYTKAFYPTGSSYIDSNKASYYYIQPSLSAPYKAGILKRDTLTVMQSAINFYRWLVGVSSLKRNCETSDDLQAAALVRNFHFAHVVQDAYKPSDMSVSLWNYGTQAEHHIISKNTTPQKTIAAWLDEGYNQSSASWTDKDIGHRMVILDSSVSGLDFGYCGTACVGRYTERNGSAALPFIPYPSAGYMPLNDLPAQTSAWSVQLVDGKLTYDSVSKISVTVKNETTGASYTCTSANGKLKLCRLANGMESVAFVQPPVNSGTYYYKDGESYSITITGIKDVTTGYGAQIHYTVKLFDVLKYIRSTVASAEPVDYSELTVYQPNATPELIDALTQVLPESVTVTAKSGFTVTVPITSEGWHFDESDNCFHACANSAYLPGILTDPSGLLNDITVKLTIDSNEKMQYNIMEVPEIAQDGSSAEFRIWRYYNNLEHSRIYQLTGTVVKKRFDSWEDTYSAPDGQAYHIYTKNTVSASDSGDYFGIYFSDALKAKKAFVTNKKSMQVITGTQCGLVIETLPDKLVYLPGERIDLTGMSLLVLYDDGSVARVTDFAGYVLKIYDHSSTDATVEFTYGNSSVTFDVLYTADTIDYMLISKLPDKLNYAEGDYVMDLSGGQLMICRDGQNPEIIPMSSAAVSGFDATTQGEKIITLTYQGMKAAFSVYVGPKNYTVTWKVGLQSYQTTVQINEVPVFPGTTTKPSDRLYDYQFIGWDKTIVPATKNITYTACFARKLHTDLAPNTFPDVDNEAWYCTPILRAVQLELFSGYANGCFGPSDSMTRAMLVTVLWSLEGNPEPLGNSTFTDVSAAAWYAKPVQWAAECGIVSGVGSGKFAPNANITREQLAAILYKYSSGKGSAGGTVSIRSYPDANKLSAWAWDAYAWALANGILSGVKSGTDIYLKPQNNATRAEAATMLIAYLTRFEDDS